MDGIININKPQGETSARIAQTVRRLTGERRVGHAGTLDPLATGVLPVCLGRGTRVIEYLMETTKVYRAEIELGAVSDTYDADGRITHYREPSAVTSYQLRSVLDSFCGWIQQIPPMYSAVKYHRQPLYKLARAGITVEREKRSVRIDSIELVNWQSPVFVIEVACGKGTYIRSLANDIGQILGCGAYLKNLVRFRYGLFTIEDAIELSRLEDACHYGYWTELVYPVDSVLSLLKAVVVDQDIQERISHGRPVTIENDDLIQECDGSLQSTLPQDCQHNRCRAYTLDGCFLGVLRFNPESQQWLPEKVFI